MKLSSAACRMLILATVSQGAFAIFPLTSLDAALKGDHWGFLHSENPTFKDLVCEITRVTSIPIDCVTIAVQPERDGMVEVDFQVEGKPANVVLTTGCLDVAESYMKFQALLQPDWQADMFKQRVIDFFSNATLVEQVDSARCNMVSYSFPETDNVQMMELHCVEGIDCVSFNAHPDGLYSMTGENIEVHSKLNGEDVSLIVEYITKHFDFRTATVPDGKEPTVHAVDLPGHTSDYPGMANYFVPLMMTSELQETRKLLIHGEPDPDNVALWPMSEQLLPRLVTSFFKGVISYVYDTEHDLEESSFREKLCSCPLFETICETLRVEQVPEENAMVVKFQHDREVNDEAEVWFPQECQPVLLAVAEVMSNTRNMKEFLIEIYHSASILSDISAGKCSLFKLRVPFSSYVVDGGCGKYAGGRGCIRLKPTSEGTTELLIKDFMGHIVHTGHGAAGDVLDASDPREEQHTSVNINGHDAKVKFNMRTASILESDENININVHVDGHTRMDSSLKEVLAWAGRVEIVNCVRDMMSYLRYGRSPDEGISLWPLEAVEREQTPVHIGIVF